jgi:phosphate uptake regulator
MPFKRIYDALTKAPLLENAYKDAWEMHKLDKEMFEESTTCLIGCEIEVARKMSLEDKRINKLEKKVRRKVMEYLAITTAPNLSASLILISIVIDYERIGDLCKNIAQVCIEYPADFGDEVVVKDIFQMKDCLSKMFDLTLIAIEQTDSEKAKEVIGMHNKVKGIHNNIIKTLNEDEKIVTTNAISYALLSGYFRRINAHLANICTGVLHPFPALGFGYVVEEDIEGP